MDTTFSWVTVIGLGLVVVIMFMQGHNESKKEKKQAKENTEAAKTDLEKEVKTGTWATITNAVSKLVKRKKEEKEL